LIAIQLRLYFKGLDNFHRPVKIVVENRLRASLSQKRAGSSSKLWKREFTV